MFVQVFSQNNLHNTIVVNFWHIEKTTADKVEKQRRNENGRLLFWKLSISKIPR